MVNERELRAARALAKQARAFTASLPPQFLEQVNEFVDRYRVFAEGVAEHAQAVSQAIERSGIAEVARFAGEAFARLRQALPPNWPVDIDYLDVIELSNSGIPTAWVPSADLLAQVLELGGTDARLQFLLEAKGELAADARAVLEQVTHPALAPQLPLAVDVVDTWVDGHERAAQALAVAVIETIASNHLADTFKRRNKKVGWNDTRIDLDGPGGLLTLAELRVTVAIAPLASFYTHYLPSRGEAMPTLLSRHAATHQAHVDHFTDVNALVATLLMASILRATHDLLAAVDAQNTPGDDSGGGSHVSASTNCRTAVRASAAASAASVPGSSTVN